MRPLFEWNVFSVTEEGWEDDTRRLVAEIEKATRLPAKADFGTLLRDVGAAQQRVAELEQTRHLQASQIDGLRRTVEELTHKLAEAPVGERPALAEAFAALARGDSLAAEDAFEREFEAQSRTADEARKTMAEAARNVANLALLRDITKAVSFYRKALAFDSEHGASARLLGHALILLGDLDGAQAAFSQSLKAAIAQGDARGEVWAQNGLGDVFRVTGNLDAANGVYMAALRLAERALSADPANTQWQRELSVSHNKLGDVLMVRGNGPGALAAYRQSHAIFEALAARDPANTASQRDLSVSHIKISDVLEVQGDGPGALAAYRRSLAIAEALAARARAPVKARTQRGGSPRQAKRSLACNRRLLRRGNTGWGAAGSEQPVRNRVIKNGATQAKQAGHIRDPWWWVKPGVWTDRMLKRLEQSEPTTVWFGLWDKVWSPKNLQTAFWAVWRNDGAPGVDGQSVEQFDADAEAEVARLSEELRKRWPNRWFAEQGLYSLEHGSCTYG